MTFNTHLDLVQRLRIRGAIHPSPLYTFMKWRGTISHLPLFTLPYLFVFFPSLFLIYLFVYLFIPFHFITFIHSLHSIPFHFILFQSIHSFFYLFIYLFVCLFVWRPVWRSRCSDSLRAGRSVYWTPVRTKISVTVHIRPEVHPASRTKGTGSFSGLKRPRRGADYPPLLATRLQTGWSYIPNFRLSSVPI